MCTSGPERASADRRTAGDYPDTGPVSLRDALRESHGVLRLTSVRLLGQFGDGMFQAALSGAILFNPERQTDPLAIAAGFAVLLLPYSLIGPYAGALLDRWDRRQVLLTANMLRAALIAVVSVGLLTGIRETPLLLFALAVVGISRFTAAGVSAALPRVLARAWLVPANSVFATIGSGCAGLGAAVSVTVIAVLGAGDYSSAVAVAVSAAAALVCALLAAGFGAGVLGPEQRAALTGRLRAIAAGLRTGAAAVWSSTTVTTAMIGIGTHRIAFGVNTLIMVLVLREAPADGVSVDSGLLGFGVAITATAAGMLVAAVIAPVLIPRLGRPRTVVLGLATATIVQLCLVTPVALATTVGAAEHAHRLLLAGAFLFGLAGQTIKLTGDAAMQIDIEDSRRGQVFALQDTVFNIAFVLAIAVTALIVPTNGRSLPVVLACAAIYSTGILAILANSRR